MTDPSLASMARFGPLIVVVVAMAFGARVALGRGVVRRPIWLTGLVGTGALSLVVALTWARVLPETYLRFERPTLLLLGFFVLLFAAVRSAESRFGGSLGRRRLLDASTAAAIMAANLAAAGPEVGLPLDRLTVVVVLDRSRSIDLVPSAEERIRRELAFAEASMREDDGLARAVFASGAATEELPRPKRAPSSPQRIELGREATDIAAGLRQGLAEVPSDSAGRLVLISDGVATRGDALAAAAAAAASRVPVDVIALEQRTAKGLRLAALRLPSVAAEGEALPLRAVVESPEATEIEVRVKRDGVLVRRVQTRVEAGEDVVALTENASDAGLHRYDVEITASEPRLDEMADDNSRAAFVRVRGAARALVIDGDAGKTAFVASALRAAKLVVEEGGISAVPTDIAAMAAYDVIVLGDVPALALSSSQIEGLAGFARELGGGLILLGGDRSFGPGGYSRSAIEEVSPVSFDLKQQRRRASLAEVIAIDISGSMSAQEGGRTKLELANEAAARSAALLGEGDLLGVNHVDTESHWTLPLGPITDKRRIEQAIRAAQPGGGGILVDLALQHSYAALAQVTVNLKHVLLFADGSDAERITTALMGSVSRAAAGGITTSVVALGQGPDVPACEELSRRGKGRFYLVESAARLPAVFTQETILASRSALVERPFTVARQVGHPALQGVDVGSAPELDGYVVTIAKPRADVVLSGIDGDPVLAEWQVGLGRVAAFTSDLKDRWGTRWTSWEGAARLIAQLARHVARREDDQRVRLDAELAGGQLELRATVVDDDGRLASFRRLEAVIRGPQGYSKRVPLEAAAAGSYRASVPLELAGAYVTSVVDALDRGVVATAGVALGLGDELRVSGTDAALLGRIAELSSGKRRDTLAGVFDDRGPRRFAYEDVTTELLALAAFAWLAAVASRRLSIFDEASLLFRRRIGQLPEEVAQPSVAPNSEGASTLSRLSALSSQRGRARELDRPTERHLTPQGPRVEVEPRGVDLRPTTVEARPVAGPSTEPERDFPDGAAASRQPLRDVASPSPSSPVRESPSVSEVASVLDGDGTGAKGRSAAEILLERRKNRR